MRAFLKTVGSPLRRPSAARNDSSRDDGPVTASFRDPAEVAKIWSSIQTVRHYASMTLTRVADIGLIVAEHRGWPYLRVEVRPWVGYHVR